MKKLALLPLLLIVLAGCDSNPTNEPAVDEINKAVEAKFKAIDDDPKLTPEQKAEMKKHMSGPAKSGSSERAK